MSGPAVVTPNPTTPPPAAAATPPAPAAVSPAAAAPIEVTTPDEDDAIFNEAIADIEKKQAAATAKPPAPPADDDADDATMVGDPPAAAAKEGEPAKAAAPAAPAEPAKPAAPKAEDLIVGGDTPEEIRANVETMGKLLGRTPEEIELLVKHNMEKRWLDTRKSYDTVAKKLADMERKLAEIEAGKNRKPTPDSPAAGAADSGQDVEGEGDWESELSEEEKTLVSQNPELLSLLKKTTKHQAQRAEALARKILAETKVVESQKLEQVRAEEAATNWRSGVNTLVPGGLDLYYSPEFIAWETQNKARLSSLLKGYDQFNPQGTALEIRLYQQERAAAEKDRQVRSDVLATATVPAGRKTSAATQHADGDDDDAVWNEAAKAAEKRQRERTGRR